MSRLLRLALVGIFGLVPLGVPVAASAATPTAFSEIAGCISGADNVLVSVVVDESLSLRETDPTDLRVQGITTAVDSLEQLAGSVDRSTSIQVSLSTFARGFDTLVGWRELNARTAAELRDTATEELPARDAGDATDYRQALDGARRSLDERQRQLDDPNACKVLLWFTDGALDVDDQTATAADELCRVGGIADSVRDDGIAVVALALFTPGAGVTDDQREQLRSVAEGSGAGTSCGTTPIPTDSASGIYLPADDPAALQRLFAGAGTLVAGGTEVETVTCPSPQCPKGEYPLTIDPGVAGARVLVQSGGDAPSLSLTSPSGETIELTSGQTETVDGATVQYLVRDRLATLDVAYDPYTADSQRWRLRPGVGSELSVYWFWGARLTLENTELGAGEDNEIRVRLEDQDGNPLPTELFSDAQAELVVGEQPLDTRLTTDGMLVGVLPLGVDDLPSRLPVSASVAVRSVPSDVPLGPISLSERLPVALPPAYPTVSPQELDFGHLEGLGTATAELEVTGSDLGPSEVCVTGSTVTVPGADPQEGLITSADECVSVDEGETRTLPLELTPEQTVDGIATGELQLSLSAADGSEDLGLTVPTRLDMERHVDEQTRWLLIAALVALALLLPLLLLVGSNLLLGRFMLTSTSRTASKTVRVTPTGLRPLHGSTLLEPEDFDNAPFSGTRKSRRMDLAGTGITLGARRIVSLKDPEGVATGPEGRLLVSGVMPYRGKARNEAPVALSELDASFVILHGAPTDHEVDGTLVMVVPGSVDRRGILDRAQRMSSVPPWSTYLEEEAATAAETAPTPEPAPEPASAYRVDQASPVGGATVHDDLPWASPPSSTAPDDDDPPPLPDFLR